MIIYAIVTNHYLLWERQTTIKIRNAGLAKKYAIVYISM